MRLLPRRSRLSWWLGVQDSDLDFRRCKAGRPTLRRTPTTESRLGAASIPCQGTELAALMRCATRPPLFKEIRSDFPDGPPSETNLNFWLVKRGYTGEAAGKAAQAYLTTMRLVGGTGEDYKPPSEPPKVGDAVGLNIHNPPTQQPPPGLHADKGLVMRTAVFNLPEGDVTLTYPAVLSEDSLNLLGHHLHLTVYQAKWAKKAAPVLYPPDAKPS